MADQSNSTKMANRLHTKHSYMIVFSLSVSLLLWAFSSKGVAQPYHLNKASVTMITPETISNKTTTLNEKSTTLNNHSQTLYGFVDEEGKPIAPSKNKDLMRQSPPRSLFQQTHTPITLINTSQPGGGKMVILGPLIRSTMIGFSDENGAHAKCHIHSEHSSTQNTPLR